LGGGGGKPSNVEWGKKRKKSHAVLLQFKKPRPSGEQKQRERRVNGFQFNQTAWTWD